MQATQALQLQPIVSALGISPSSNPAHNSSSINSTDSGSGSGASSSSSNLGPPQLAVAPGNVYLQSQSNKPNIETAAGQAGNGLLVQAPLAKEGAAAGGEGYPSPNSPSYSYASSELECEVEDGLLKNQYLPAKCNEQAIAALTQRTGYVVLSELGQRRYVHPDQPHFTVPRGCQVFVGRVPSEAFEDELVPVFERVGRIVELRLMLDVSGVNRGYAFVTYSRREEAKRAVAELNNYELRTASGTRSRLGICLSINNCRLFVGGIPKTRSKEDILVEMKRITEGVRDVIVYPSASDKTKNRGFAFVEYSSHKQAAAARKKLMPGKIQLWGHSIAVDWAEPERDVDEDVMSNVKVLYVRNLMLSTAEETIRNLFNQAVGKTDAIERVKKIRDFCFVHFKERQDALLARDKMNNASIEGVLVEVVLAKPPDKTDPKYQAAHNAKTGSGTPANPAKPASVQNAPPLPSFNLGGLGLNLNLSQLSQLGLLNAPALGLAGAQGFAGLPAALPGLALPFSQLNPLEQLTQLSQLQAAAAAGLPVSGIGAPALLPQLYLPQLDPYLAAVGSFGAVPALPALMPQGLNSPLGAQKVPNCSNSGANANAAALNNAVAIPNALSPNSAAALVNNQLPNRLRGRTPSQTMRPSSGNHSYSATVAAAAQQNREAFIRKNPSEILEEFCQKNSLGTPLFQLFTALSPDGVDIQMYLFKVTIPALQNTTLTPPKLSSSIEEARQLAAESALSNLHQMLGIPAVQTEQTQNNGVQQQQSLAPRPDLQLAMLASAGMAPGGAPLVSLAPGIFPGLSLLNQAQAAAAARAQLPLQAAALQSLQGAVVSGQAPSLLFPNLGTANAAEASLALAQVGARTAANTQTPQVVQGAPQVQTPQGISSLVGASLQSLQPRLQNMPLQAAMQMQALPQYQNLAALQNASQQAQAHPGSYGTAPMGFAGLGITGMGFDPQQASVQPQAYYEQGALAALNSEGQAETDWLRH